MTNTRQAPEQRLDAAAQAVRLPPTRVRRYVRLGLVRPSHVEGRAVYFGEPELARLRRIRRLRDDLDLNVAGVEVVLRLLDEIEALHREIDQREQSQGGARWPSR